jgi:elongation factor P--(R)-beta-lysine ligase
MPSDLLNLLVLRARTFAAIREFFDEKGFFEVDTPLLVAAPDTEPTIEPFETTWNELGQSHKAYLVPSPEILIKRLLAHGPENFYQLSHVFRNFEPSQGKHNPEFMMLEWYRSYADYNTIMEDAEELISFIVSSLLHKGYTLNYQGFEIDLTGGWERLSVCDAFDRYAGISRETLLNQTVLIEVAKAKGYNVEGGTYDDAFFQVFLNEIEGKLGFGKPTFLYDYPVSQAALARKKEADPRLAERFELYIAGVELANAFTELTNAEEQEKRLQLQVSIRKANNQPIWKYDHQFVDALKQPMPVTGGIALGVDRLIMLLADKPDVMNVLPFPASTLFGGGSD